MDGTVRIKLRVTRRTIREVETTMELSKEMVSKVAGELALRCLRLRSTWSYSVLMWLMTREIGQDWTLKDYCDWLEEKEGNQIHTPTIRTLRTAIHELVENELLKEGSTGKYQLNGAMFYVDFPEEFSDESKEGNMGGPERTQSSDGETDS